MISDHIIRYSTDSKSVDPVTLLNNYAIILTCIQEVIAMHRTFSSRPISRLILVAMIVVSLVPVGLLTLYLYHSAWENSWREIHEKHQLLAENLAHPISIYVRDHSDVLTLIGQTIQAGDKSTPAIRKILNSVMSSVRGFKSLNYIDVGGKSMVFSAPGRISRQKAATVRNIFTKDSTFRLVSQTRRLLVSGIKSSPYTQQPVIFMLLPIKSNGTGKLQAILIAELSVDFIEQIRRGIKFGERGHSAIVDQNGKVIAHPNPDWMKQMRDLSGLNVVQLMMSGKTGVTEFYSPFVKQDMVVGYASIPGLGWGVMVPQPKSEVIRQVQKLMASNYALVLAGLLLAGILAYYITKRITRPINQLADNCNRLFENNLQGEFVTPDSSPQEIAVLGKTVATLVGDLQKSRAMVQDINLSLQEKIDQATCDLRVANEKLEQTVHQDYLTALSNRRYFEIELEELILRRRGDIKSLCLMLFDVDDFKLINDQYGHAAGDAVLTCIARTLESFMRRDDMVARYAGDEFVARINCCKDVALQRAEEIRKAVQEMCVSWEGSTLNVTVSIGVYCRRVTGKMDICSMVHNVDEAMYQAKKLGRNRCELFYVDHLKNVQSSYP